jgi:hypothetical protein
MRSDLKDLQALLYSAITAAPGAARTSRGAALSGAIRGDERLSAVQRLNIYADAYFYRLLDCLKEDFPATAAVTGEAFENVVRAYLDEHPPTEPSIFYAGQHLADFLGNRPVGERWPFLAELARLERTLIEVFHGPDAPLLSAAEMQNVRPEEWPALGLHIQPALRMLDCQWRVSEVLSAIENGSQWQEPGLGPVFLLVWRQNARVYFRELEAPERAALEAASKGANFGAVCDVFASWFDGKSAAAGISQMLARWLADGVLTRGESPFGQYGLS